MTLTPHEARKALWDYTHLASFLEHWFPGGRGTAQIFRGSATGRPVERYVLARADVQSVLDALTYAVSLLGPEDRQLVQVYYFERRGSGAAERLGISRRAMYRRLDLISAEVAATLSGMDMRFWRAFRRFARAVLEDTDEVPD